MKTGKYIWYPIILVVVTVICILVGVGMHFGIGPWHEETSPVSVTEADFFTDGLPAAEELTGIHIDSDFIDITMREGDAFGIQYSGEERQRPTIEAENGVLTIKQKNGFDHLVTFGFGVKEASLTITLPGTVMLQSVTGDMDAANIDIQSLHCSNIQLSADAGNISMKDCSMVDGNIETDAGNLNMSNCTFEILELESDAGKINMDGVTDFRSLKVSCDAGDVTLHAGCDLSQYTWNLENDLGTVRYNGTELGAKHSRHGTAGRIEMSCDLGNINITDVQGAV